MLLFLTALICFFILEILYFKLADRFNIIDKPNQRSSHTQITLRGGGIIFPIALITGVLIFQPDQCYLALGVFAIAGISFLDDILTLNNKLRIGVHCVSVLLILAQIVLNQNIPISTFLAPSSLLLALTCNLFLILAIVLIIGIINAYNFMDGINGITVLYSLATVISFIFIQQELNFSILNVSILYMLIASLGIFGYFNLRTKAKAFAGDVGSIAMALIISFFIGTLIFQTRDPKWILLLGIYGLDAVATIVCRIIRKENIFDAHRSHFYQFLANEKRWPHVLIAVLYAFFQLLLNGFLVYLSAFGSYLLFCVFVISYIVLRLRLEGKKRLFIVY
jgi:UDP-N-acetylmuramyl pentapeptide phosphotransferase/UDP-N-acetylglucosamine-1-phosphate transferase